MKDYRYYAEVIRVVDGDTVDLIVDLGFNVKVKERFRLLGINAPETRTRDLKEKKLGKASKKYLTEFLKNMKSRLIIETVKDKKGKYGRYLCKLIDINLDLTVNEMMIVKGFAEVY